MSADPRVAASPEHETLTVAREMATACLVYAVVFVCFGLTAHQRRTYFSQVVKMLQRRTHAAVPESA